jgi:hypothetical protein
MRLCPLAQPAGAVALAALFLGLAAAPANSQEAPAVVLSYSAPANVVLHQPIVATLVVRNNRPEPVRLRLGLGNSHNFVVKIVRPDGAVIDAPAVPEIEEGVYRTGRHTVPALGRYTHSLVLDRWHSFDRPGTYRIEIDLSTAVETESGVPIASTTRGVMQVRVGGYDEKALHKICQEILDRITQSTLPTVRYVAAEELANVNNNLAFTYIMQAIDFTDKYDRVLIPALIRMKTLQAQAVLDQMAQSNNETRASMALSAVLKEKQRMLQKGQGK